MCEMYEHHYNWTDNKYLNSMNGENLQLLAAELVEFENDPFKFKTSGKLSIIL